MTTNQTVIRVISENDDESDSSHTSHLRNDDESDSSYTSHLGK